MHTIQWRCVNGASDFVGDSIDFIERGCVCHVEPLVDGVAIGAHSNGGVQRRPIDPRPVDFRFQATVTDAQYAAAMEFLNAQIGKPYDFFEIAGILCNRNWRRPNSWICSELLTAWLEIAGVVGKFPSCVNLITPQDCLIYSCALSCQAPNP